MGRCKRATAVTAAALVLGGRLAQAAGPVEITACTTITQPGSYVLVNNLTPALPGDCLIVDANFVTIDLGGFLIRGNTRGGGDKVGAGVRTPVPQSSPPTACRGLAIRNGTIAQFANGILLNGADLEIERIRALENQDNGIFIGVSASPTTAIVRDCVASGNGAYGIRVHSLFVSTALVTGNMATANGAGIRVDCPAAVVGNTAAHNTADDILLDGPGCSAAHNATTP